MEKGTAFPYLSKKKHGSISSMTHPRIAWIADQTPTAEKVLKETHIEGVSPDQADVLVCVGGDGFMLHSIQTYRALNKPFFGLNAGSVGFLMNPVSKDVPLTQRLQDAHTLTLHPLKGMIQTPEDTLEVYAINEISFLRLGAQAAKVRIHVDHVVRLNELVCDGAMVATPAGSTAYNFSAYGPILPLESALLALTPISAFRPRRWRGALIPNTSSITFEILEPSKRPVVVYVDGTEMGEALTLTIQQETHAHFQLMFDRGRDLSERILTEQFSG